MSVLSWTRATGLSRYETIAETARGSKLRKIGRNDPCPCGSGKKYKRCCLDVPIVSDRFTHTLFDRMKALRGEIKHSFEEAQRRVVEMAEATIHQGEPEAVCAQIVQYLQWLEGEVRPLISRRSGIFWLCLDRRFPPGFDEVGDDLRRRSMSQAFNIVKTLLFHKHGNAVVEPFTMQNDSTFDFEVEDEDIVLLFGALRAYFHELVFLQNEYRRVGKGAVPHTEKKIGLITKMPAPMEDLVRLYDERRMQGNGGYVSPGGLGSFPARELKPSDKAIFESLSTIAAIPTPGDHAHVIDGMGRVKSPGFDLFELALDRLEHIRAFEARFPEVVGLTLDQLRDCYVAMKQYLLTAWGPGAEYTLVSRGIWFVDDATLRRRLGHAYAATITGRSSDTPDAIVERFLRLLEGDPRSGDLLIRQKQCSLSRFPTICALDLSLAWISMLDFLTDLTIDSEMKRVNGSQFEDYVTRTLAEAVPDLKYPIAPGLALKRTGEKKSFAQFDTYAQVDDMLFLIESKAYSVTREYLKGTPQAVWGRWILVEEWVRSSDRRSHKIASTHTGSNFSIPQDVKFVVPVICSAFSEFIWSGDEHFYLQPGRTPRVCTLDELIDTMTVDRASLQQRPFTIAL